MTEPRYPTLHVDVPARDVDHASTTLWNLGATGVEERDASTLDKSGGDGALLVAHFDDDDQARIAASVVTWPSRVVHVVGDDWRHRWREHFKPTRIGRRLLIRPSWEEVTPKDDDVVLTLDPGQAFGTGTHETTRLVLAELEQRVKGGEHVLDVGCGSGILSIAAILLGAEDAVSIDIDDDSMNATAENAAANGVTDRIEPSRTPLAKVRGQFPLVVANIEARVLIPMAKELMAHVEPSGLLVLSGLLLQDEDEILEAYATMQKLARGQQGEWIALTFTAPAKQGAAKSAASDTNRKRATVKKTAKKSASKKSTAKKSAKKSAARKAPAKKIAKKAPARKAAKKSVAKKTAKKSAARKTAKKSAARKTAKKAPAKKAAKRSPAR